MSCRLRLRCCPGGAPWKCRNRPPNLVWNSDDIQTVGLKRIIGVWPLNPSSNDIWLSLSKNKCIKLVTWRVKPPSRDLSLPRLATWFHSRTRYKCPSPKLTNWATYASSVTRQILTIFYPSNITVRTTHKGFCWCNHQAVKVRISKNKQKTLIFNTWKDWGQDRIYWWLHRTYTLSYALRTQISTDIGNATWTLPTQAWESSTKTWSTFGYWRISRWTRAVRSCHTLTLWKERGAVSMWAEVARWTSSQAPPKTWYKTSAIY